MKTFWQVTLGISFVLLIAILIAPSVPLWVAVAAYFYLGALITLSAFLDVRHIPACDGGIYLTRITLFRAFGGKLMINVFRKSDERDLHDHPWNFWSLIIWRGYIETRACQGDYANQTETCRVFPGMLLRRRTWDVHRVQLVNNKPAVSLVWRGPRQRVWGFHTPDQGWVNHREWWFLRGCHKQQTTEGDKDND